MAVPYHDHSSSSSSSSNSTTNWGPYSGAGDFGANMVVVLVIIFCVLVLVLAVNALIRYLLCAARAHRRRIRRQNDLEKGPNNPDPPTTGEVGPALIFSTGIELAGTAAECSICLAEFADGDRVRVLPPCNHGFHVSCIEKWLAAKKSCPTCRAICQVAV